MRGGRYWEKEEKKRCRIGRGDMEARGGDMYERRGGGRKGKNFGINNRDHARK